MRWIYSATCVLLTSGWLLAQDVEQPENSNSADLTEELDSLRALAKPLSDALDVVDELQAELNTAETVGVKEEFQTRIEAEKQRVTQLREYFRDELGGSEAAEFEDVEIQTKGIQEQISELVQPVLSEMRDATAGPRELDALRKALEAAKERKRNADIVVTRIDKLLAATNDEVLIEELQSARRIWTSRQAQANSQIAVNEVQIDYRTRDQRSIWERLSTGFSKFFKSRGMNLLFAVLAGFIGFFAIRKIYSWLRRISPVHKKDKNNFTAGFPIFWRWHSQSSSQLAV